MPSGVTEDLGKREAIILRGQDGQSVYGGLLRHGQTPTRHYPEGRFRKGADSEDALKTGLRTYLKWGIFPECAR